MAKPGKLKKLFYKLFDPLAFKLGYQKKEFVQPAANTFNASNKNNLLFNFCSVLKSVNFYPKHIVDVGANHGAWTREVLKYFPDAYFTMLEPQPQMKESVKDILADNPKISFHSIGAGKSKGNFMFTIVERDDSCSFTYSAQEALEKNYMQMEVPVVTLNEFIQEKHLPIPDIIKIDAEGLDIDVLEGSNNFFGKTEIYMIEAGIVNKKFENSFLKIINYMDENGYTLFDITDLNRPFDKQVLWLTELVFIKKNGLIDAQNWN